jgi:mannan endo-1,4-beta-mannosidase
MNTAGWKIGIVREFIGDLLHQPMSGRVVHSGSSWLHPLQSIVDTNRRNSIVTILCPFGWNGTSDFSGSNPREMPFFVDYKRRWQAVAKQFASQSDVWLELWNEPYNWHGQNFSDSMWLSDAIEMVENIRSVNQNIIVVPGALDGQDESIILRQGRALLTGRSDLVFDVHGYERWMKSGITSTSVKQRISAVADVSNTHSPKSDFSAHFICEPANTSRVCLSTHR